MFCFEIWLGGLVRLYVNGLVLFYVFCFLFDSMLWLVVRLVSLLGAFDYMVDMG